MLKMTIKPNKNHQIRLFCEVYGLKSKRHILSEFTLSVERPIARLNLLGIANFLYAHHCIEQEILIILSENVFRKTIILSRKYHIKKRSYLLLWTVYFLLWTVYLWTVYFLFQGPYNNRMSHTV